MNHLSLPENIQGLDREHDHDEVSIPEAPHVGGGPLESEEGGMLMAGPANPPKI